MLVLRQWMDLCHRPHDDFCGVIGFIVALRDVLRLKRGGMMWVGHPCNPLLDRMFIQINCDPSESSLKNNTHKSVYHNTKIWYASLMMISITKIRVGKLGDPLASC